MRIWENKAIKLIKQNLSEFQIIDILQTEMKEAGIFAEEHLIKPRIDMAQQIFNNVKDK